MGQSYTFNVTVSANSLTIAPTSQQAAFGQDTLYWRLTANPNDRYSFQGISFSPYSADFKTPLVEANTLVVGDYDDAASNQTYYYRLDVYDSQSQQTISSDPYIINRSG